MENLYTDLTLSIAFPILEIPPWSSLCSVASLVTVSLTFLADCERIWHCSCESSSWFALSKEKISNVTVHDYDVPLFW